MTQDKTDKTKAGPPRKTTTRTRNPRNTAPQNASGQNTHTQNASKKNTGSPKERIAKYMARAGLCSRRDAERWIAQGRVSVNGKILDTPAITVSPSDRILVDNKPVRKKEATRLFLYHKPAGLITTQKDEQGRKTVFDALPPDMPRVISVGRLDMNTEGLLLLTNDGALSRYLELPATGWKRRYRVRAFGTITQTQLDKLKNGITYEGITYGPIEATLEQPKKSRSPASSGKNRKQFSAKPSASTPPQADTDHIAAGIGTDNIWLDMAVREGKNREIRKICEAIGLQVNRLIRVSYGPFQLGQLPRGAIKEIPAKVIKEQIPDFKT